MPQPEITADQLSKARWLVGEARKHGGLAPLDVEKFWAEQDVAIKDCFSPTITQCALGILMGGECVYDELGIPEDYRHYENDDDWAVGLNKRYNDLSEKIVGRRLLGEQRLDRARLYPPRKALHDIFEGRNLWHGHSWWLRQVAHNEDELKALLDRVDKRLENLRPFLLPENWEPEKARLMALGVKPAPYRNQRGPVTFAMSLYGVENTIFLILDKPDLAARFRDTIIRAMLETARIIDEEAGCTPETAPRGFGFADDNCAMLTPEMYEFFGYPVLKAVFARYSPDPKDRRGQHSDSAMGHLLPILGRLDFMDVNFGPTLSVAEIRQHCPRSAIIGQLAPFTFCRNQEEQIVAEFIRDFEQARAKRGLWFYTAGSINNGSRLTGMRLIMSAIQHFGQYDG